MGRDLAQFINDNFDKAIDYHYIQPYYQPVIRTASRKLCSFEVLSRWNDPELGMIYPDEFIPVLEESGKIHKLDEHIIRQACRRLNLRMASGDTPVPISVNLSRKDFELCDIYSTVDKIVSDYHLPHDFVYIEITESVMAEQKELMMSVVERFHSNGYKVWMDDFGSAYSSLNILKDFQFDELKLDMGFLRPFNQRSQKIATSVIEMAKGIDTHTLAEGVETEEQFRYLRNIGCEKVQGYYFGRPLPYEEAIRNIEEHGIHIERPQDRKYYDDIGLVNYLSAVPFMTREERDSIRTARQLNSIPLAIVEMHKNSFSVLFYNSAFEETAKETGMFANIFKQELLRKHQPFNLLSERVINLMDSTLDGEEGHTRFASHGDYYEIQAKCIAKTEGKYSVLMRLSNLSKEAKTESTHALDDSLKRVYAMFERITLVDLESDTIKPLSVATREQLVSGNRDVTKLVHEYADKYLYPEDRETYFDMLDPKTVEDRFVNHGMIYMTRILRAHAGHGEYIWKEFTVLRLEKNRYLLMVRRVHNSVIALENKIYRSFEEGGDHAPSLLWENLMQSDLLRIFWKGKDRRFIGASNAFLKYYGFDSVDDIVGKTDEDMGWHLHPGKFMSDEIEVISEGVTTHNVPGRCLAKGENREILASKAPLYDRNGEISGLLGYFVDRELLTVNDSRGAEIKRRDIRTGLLNTRGIAEEANRFRDEYYLTKADFVRMHVTIDDFSSINEQYGYDFGDKVIAAFGKALKKEFGRKCVVGRGAGANYVMLKQIEDVEEVHLLREKVRHSGATIREIDGISLTLYSSVGFALFSESEDLSEQENKAERRILADHNRSTSNEVMVARSAELFHLFDDLPIGYAVYHMTRKVDDGPTDAVFFYVNHEYEKYAQMSSEETLGRAVRELYPFMPEDWYENLTKSSFSDEQTEGEFVFEVTGKRYKYTARQIIYAGYCAVTYQELDQGLAVK